MVHDVVGHEMSREYPHPLLDTPSSVEGLARGPYWSTPTLRGYPYPLLDTPPRPRARREVPIGRPKLYIRDLRVILSQTYDDSQTQS